MVDIDKNSAEYKEFRRERRENFVNNAKTVKNRVSNNFNFLGLFLLLLIGITLFRFLISEINGTDFSLPTLQGLLERLSIVDNIDLTWLQIGTLNSLDWGAFQILGDILNFVIQLINVATMLVLGLVQVLTLIISLFTWVIGI